MRNLRRPTVRLVAAALLAGLPFAAAQTSDTAPVPVVPTTTPGLSTSTTVSVIPALERFTVWGGLSSELVVLPGVNVGVSAPVGSNLTLRGTVGATLLVFVGDGVDENGALTGAAAGLPLPTVGADLLFGRTSPGTRVYGGPSLAVAFGLDSNPVFAVGGVAGIRGDFGGGPWGYYAEAKLRALLVPGAALPSPGLNIGVTYRF